MMRLLHDHSEKRARSAADAIRASGFALIDSTHAELFELLFRGEGQEMQGGRAVRMLLDKNNALLATNEDFAARLESLSGEIHLTQLADTWFGALRRLVRRSHEPCVAEPVSWQDVHCRDTFGLERHGRAAPAIGAHAALTVDATTSPPTAEFGWARENAALIHLLRTGQWHSVPSLPPDCWVERLTKEFSGTTMNAARKLLTVVLEAAPRPARATYPEPLSADEREWVRRNIAAVHGLSIGQLRGIPATPSRTWVAALQSAVGGTMIEIAAILAVVVNIAPQVQLSTIAK